MLLLSTKLSIPPLRSGLVVRSRLVQKLNQGRECGFVLVSAPAGYGKSTLLSAWLSRAELAAAWLSLDNRDNVPSRFLEYLVAALRLIDPSIDDALDSKLNINSTPEVETFLTPLVNHLSQGKRPFCLVLDEYHAIHNQIVHQAVGFLLEHRPAPLRLVIATRADPPLPLAKLRARSKMVELRQVDLCFNAQEAAEFLDHTMGLQVALEDVARITRRTEGWIAGLQMAALSMQTTEDISGFIDAFTGSHYSIFDFLLEEVLEGQTPEIRRFLLYTSILDQLTAPLCDVLLGDDLVATPVHSSSDILKNLDRANLFIIPLDHERHWYRYHHLFSDLLRLMLNKIYPGLATELHRRACRWYESQGMLLEAIQHAISSGDMQLVAQMISANVLVLVESNEIGPTLAKIDSIPPDKMIALPWLEIAHAWILGGEDVQKAHQILDTVEMSANLAKNALDRQRLKGHIAAARAFVYNIQEDIPQTIWHARLADELLPADEIAVRAFNLANWGDVLSAGRRDSSAAPVSMAKYDPEALPILEQSLALALQAEKPHVAMIAASYLASALLLAGSLFELHRVCLKALTIAEDYQRRFQQPLSATAEVYALFARLLAEWGEDEKAIQSAQKGLMLSERWGQVRTEVQCLVYLGRALMFYGDCEQATQVLERADQVAYKISQHYWQRVAIFILESMLDAETLDASSIARQIRRLEEGGARTPALVRARLLLRDHQPDEALVSLEQALSEIKGQPSLDTVRILALSALAYQAKGDEPRALVELREALESGEPENRVATFVREGVAMERLLKLPQVKPIAPAFVQRLLAAFEARRKHEPSPYSAPAALIEPLSERELEVLRLLAQGNSDKQIAETLVIARETVHKHLKNIYGKLDVHSRTEAIRRAQKLGLL